MSIEPGPELLRNGKWRLGWFIARLHNRTVYSCWVARAEDCLHVVGNALAAIGGQISARWGAKRYADNTRPILRGCGDSGSQDDVNDEHDDQDQEYACEFSLWHHNPSGGLPI
jgi:hypothetical protein